MSVRAVELAAPARSPIWPRLARSRGLITAIVVFLALLFVVNAVNTAPFSYFDVSFLASGGAPLAIAAFGETSRHPHWRLRSLSRRCAFSCQRGVGGEHEPD